MQGADTSELPDTIPPSEAMPDDLAPITRADLGEAMALMNERFDRLERLMPGKAIHDLANFIQGMPETMDTLRAAANSVLIAHAEQKIISQKQQDLAAELRLMKRHQMNGGHAVEEEES